MRAEHISDKSFILRCFGARGSVPVSGREYNFYGGATSSYRIDLPDGNRIFLDGGSGLVDPRACEYCSHDTTETVLLSHVHLDHVSGLPYLDSLKIAGHAIDIYVPDEHSATALMSLYAPPYWPLSLLDYPARVSISVVPEQINVGDCVITYMAGSHPGGCLVYRIEAYGHTIVYATDYEHDGGDMDRQLEAFCRGADVLLYDGAYTADEYELYRGYGHSTPDRGARIACDAGVERLIITHHAPDHDDAFIDRMYRELLEAFPGAVFAYPGMTIQV